MTEIQRESEDMLNFSLDNLFIQPVNITYDSRETVKNRGSKITPKKKKRKR